MTCNLGGIERWIRIGLGIVLILLGYFLLIFAELSNWVWVGLLIDAAGVTALLTGAIGWCPIWKLFRINTCAQPSKGNH